MEEISDKETIRNEAEIEILEDKIADRTEGLKNYIMLLEISKTMSNDLKMDIERLITEISTLKKSLIELESK